MKMHVIRAYTVDDKTLQCSEDNELLLLFEVICEILECSLWEGTM